MASEPKSPWERAVWTLAPIVRLCEIDAENLTDSWTGNRVTESNLKRINTVHLVECHFKELLSKWIIFQDSGAKTPFPVFGNLYWLHLYQEDVIYQGALEDLNVKNGYIPVREFD